MPPRASAGKNTAAPAKASESGERPTSPRRRALRFEDDDEEDEAYGSMALAPFSARSREVSIRKIHVRGTMPLIASTLCVVCTALAAVCLQSWHIHATAMALASVRVSATNVTLAPATRRLKSLEDAVQRLEEEKMSVSDARAGGMTREMKDAAREAAETHAASAESRLRTEIRKEVSEMSTMVSGLKKEQSAFATKSDLKKMDLTKSVKKLQGAVDAAQKAQADFVSASRVDALFNAVEALKDRSTYVTSSDLDAAKRDLVTKSDLKKIDATKSVKTLQSALDKLQKAQSSFVTSAEMKKMDASKDVSRLEKSIKSLTKSRDGADVNARLQALETAIADAAKASANFASVQQLEEVVARATESVPNDAPTVSQFSALVATVDALKNAQAELLVKSDLATFESQMDLKVTKTQESVDGLLESIKTIQRVQQTFATNATIKMIEAQLEALKVPKKKSSFLTRQKELNVSQEHIAALEASVAALHKQQSELEKKHASALHASDLKNIEKSIAALEKAQADFATTAQLQKVDIVMDEIKSLQMEIEAVSTKQANFVSTAQFQKIEFVTEEIKSLQSEISAVAKTQGEFGVLSAGLKDLEQKLSAVTEGAQKKGLLAKLTKKTETNVSSKQLASLENSIAALTKAQAGFAQSANLASLESSIAALEKKHASALHASDLKNIEKSIAALEKAQADFATTAQLQKVDIVMDEIKSLQIEIEAVSTKQANFVSTAQFQKIEFVTEEIKSLQSEISAVAKTQGEFGVLSAGLKDLEQKLSAVTEGAQKKSLLAKLTKKTETNVSSKQLASLENSIAALTKAQAGFAQSANLASLESSIAALEKKHASALHASDLKNIEKSIAALEKAQADFSTTAQLQKVDIVMDEIKSLQMEIEAVSTKQANFVSTAQFQKIEFVTEEIKSLQSEISAVAKTQGEFGVLSAGLKDLEQKLSAVTEGAQKKSLLAKLTKKTETNVSSKQLASLENSIAALTKAQAGFAQSANLASLESSIAALEKKHASALHASDLKNIEKSIAALEKAQADFATTAQLQKVDIVMDEIKSLQMEIEAVSTKQANFVSTAQFQKIEFVTEEIKSLQSEISAVAKTQGEFGVLSAGLKDLEQKLSAVTEGAQKKGLLAKLTKKTETNVSSKQLASLENSIAALTKAQAGFAQSANLASLESSIAALEKKHASALHASDLKNIEKSIAALEKAQADFATTAQLQKVDVTREMKDVEDAVEQLLKEHSAYATQTSVNVLEAQVEALSGKTKASGYFKRAKDTSVPSKQIKALEDAISSLTKSQSDYATVTQLKEILTAVDTLSKSLSEYASLRALGDLETKLKDFATSEKVHSVQETNVVDLENQLLERVNQYIKAIPKDTSRKLTKHIDEAASLWFADRTGRQDFALASGGGRVVAHSQLSPFVARGDGPITAAVAFLRAGVHPKSDEWLLSPSLEQPGDCIALHSSTGYVDIRLRQSVTVDAVTLEHTNSLNAYDMHSAPRDIEVLGWLSCNKNKCKNSKPPKSLLSLGNYTYSVSHGSVQTYEVTAPHTVDHVRLVVKNNQGHKRWTCLYRFRVHGTPTHVEA